MGHRIYAKLKDDGGLLSTEPYFTSFDPRVIIREETPIASNVLNSYHIFDDIHTFEKWYVKVPEKTRFAHEVIVDNAYGSDYMPQRFVFDIDCEKISTSRDAMFADFLQQLKGAFWRVYNIVLSDENIYWCDSSDDTKFSRHVYVDGYYAMNAYENRGLVLTVNEYTGYRGKCDDGIYTQNHCLRMVYSRKTNSTRVKLPQGARRPLCDYFVRLLHPVPVTRILNKFSMPDIITDFNIYKPCIDVNTELITDHAVKAAVNLIMRNNAQGCRYIRNIGNLLLFVRVSAADCPICKVIHQKDNTMYGFISNNDVYIKCRHSMQHIRDSKAKICIGNISRFLQ
ncbi:putative helicase/primase complex protein [Faustovirus]|nr:putative helicase/primase complex protein [Faustovirus]QJX72381.1 putative helicase/primase complex protein [Faustovirus]